MDSLVSQEMAIPFSEIARHVGICTSAVAKAVQTFEAEDEKWKGSTCPVRLELTLIGWKCQGGMRQAKSFYS
jgi:hypothetical protein